jgi:alkaline phosphatase
MRRALVVLVLMPVALSAAGSRARNVILFVADAGGTSTIAAASLYGYGQPRRLFIQRMPYVALSDTATASQIVTDSAAGMTAIVTGQKTQNGVLSQSASAVKGTVDGAPLKTILEYAEEHGQSTGFITNDAVTGATPAALYAKVNDRNKTAEIFQQAFAPRYGDGVDVMIGVGRPAIAKALAEAGIDIDSLAARHDRPLLSALSQIPSGARRAIVLMESADFDLAAALDAATRILSRSPKGYFLMVEWDVHTDRIRRGLERLVALDRVIERTARTARPDTLLLFTADHSFDLRLRGGRIGQPLLDGLEAAEANAPKGPIRIPTLRMDNGHTGEPVLVAARGPGAQRVRGYMSNTDLFGVMMQAYGWKMPSGVPAADTRASGARQNLNR